MEQRRSVVLYGSSLFLLGVEVSLKANPRLNVARVDAKSPGTLEQLRELAPDVIVFDLATTRGEFAVPFLRDCPELVLIGLDLARDEVLVLSGQQSTVLSAQDLAQVIEQPPDPHSPSAPKFIQPDSASEPTP